jgi:hypothetical protein
MQRTLREVDELLEAKRELAGDRDLLQNMLCYLKERIARLEISCKKKHRYFLGRKIKHYRAIAGTIRQSIEAANEMIKSPSDSRVLKVFRIIFSFLVNKINTIKQHSSIFAHKFKAIHTRCDQMVANAIELKQLVYA